MEESSILIDDEKNERDGENHWCVTVAAATDVEDDTDYVMVGADCAKDVESTFVLMDGGSVDHSAILPLGDAIPLEETLCVRNNCRRRGVP